LAQTALWEAPESLWLKVGQDGASRYQPVIRLQSGRAGRYFVLSDITLL